MERKYQYLMSPFQIGSLKLKNRLTVAAMGDSYLGLCGPRGEYSWQGIEHCAERAKGGFSLMVNGCILFPDNKVEAQDPLMSVLDNKDVFIKQGLLLNERCSFYDMKVFQQITLGLGRNWGAMSPSALPSFDDPAVMTEALTTDQIKTKIECVVESAKLMQDAGFSGVEVHALHWGYLLDELAMAITNHREDEYGGNLENRLRACREIVQGIKQVCGSDYPVSMRLGLKSYMKGFHRPSIDGSEEAGRTLEEGVRIAEELEKYGYDVLNIDAGTYDSFYYGCPPVYMPQGHCIPLAEACKKAVNIRVICGFKMNDPAICEKGIAEGKFDAVALGRPSLVDPEYPNKVASGRVERIRPCIGCTVGCMGRSRSGELMTCAVNPQAYLESAYGLKKTGSPRNVVIAGAGVAGMQAALAAAERGFQVTVYEKENAVGGMLALAAKQYKKGQLGQLVAWYEQELERAGVKVELGRQISVDDIIAMRPDAAVLAIGGRVKIPEISGVERCITVPELLRENHLLGEHVIVAGGGLTGCDTAIDLASKGRQVTLVEAEEELLKNSKMVTVMVSQMIHDLIEYYGIQVRTGCELLNVTEESAVVREGGTVCSLPADDIVLAFGMEETHDQSAELALRAEGIEAYSAGESRLTGNVYTAVHTAYEIVRSL